MLIQDIMVQDVITVAPDLPIGEAYKLMRKHNVRHLPIMKAAQNSKDYELVGIISDRDIRLVGSQLPQAPKDIVLTDPVSKLMSFPIITTHPTDPVEESAAVLRREKIGAMPVLDDDKLVGIVSSNDFLTALVRMTGVGTAATRLEVKVPNQPGALAKLTSAIAARNINITSVLTTFDTQEQEAMTFVLRVNTMHGQTLAQALRSDGFNVLWPPDKQALFGNAFDNDGV